MAESYLTVLRKLWKPRIVKYGGAAAFTLATYDAASGQFAGLPKIGAVLGMTGSLLPWWGWLIVLQFVLLYTLFEYVRRLAPPPPPAYDDTELREKVESSTEILAALASDAQRFEARLGELPTFQTQRLDLVESALASLPDIEKFESLEKRVESQSKEIAHLYDLLARFQRDNIYEQKVLGLALEAQRDVTLLADKAARVDFAGNELIDKVEREGVGYWKTTSLHFLHPVEFWYQIARKYDENAYVDVTGCSQEEAEERAKGLGDSPLSDYDKICYASFLVMWEKWPAVRDRVAAVVQDVVHRDKARQIVQHEDLDGTTLRRSLRPAPATDGAARGS